MPLQKKRVTKGMFSADGGEEGRTGATKKKLNRPIAGLQKDQMMGGPAPEEVKDVKKGRAKKGKKAKSAKPFGGAY